MTSKKFSDSELEKLNEIIGDKEICEKFINFKSYFKKSSKDEIKFILYVVSLYKPLKYDADKKIFTGKLGKKFNIFIKLQEKAQNPKTQRFWTIDTTIEVKDLSGDSIHKIGIEYDGFPNHYVESKVKEQHQRDLTISANTNITSCFRITPEMVEEDEDRKLTARNIKKLLLNRVSDFFKYFKKKHRNINSNSKESFSLTTDFRKNIGEFECPLCKGYTKLGDDFCIECHGTGYASTPLKVPKDQYDVLEFNCPKCPNIKKPYKQCSLCKGNGSINREMAISYEKNR